MKAFRQRSSSPKASHSVFLSKRIVAMLLVGWLSVAALLARAHDSEHDEAFRLLQQQRQRQQQQQQQQQQKQKQQQQQQPKVPRGYAAPNRRGRATRGHIVRVTKRNTGTSSRNLWSGSNQQQRQSVDADVGADGTVGLRDSFPPGESLRARAVAAIAALSEENAGSRNNPSGRTTTTTTRTRMDRDVRE
mmetsp:Transcript_978/g.2436  ORF Transcript_978/g.2436 Transcript_978/m.2436 type:complete len:190 (-) Transcript_978:283-852(-)|eukprot:CAMPEP_0201229392 /NCGR_PEP_ID=MMETSP0852-20130820/902_1 /ASSEMBLY_ACC=CAM_ASM_000632 /TAXON_ID=183588 /ORGANISM="Pseudo-nitzschia fraudulenta, Strain WWA7" /LENGTH=189 /DNA_ID=CAMNT_0047519681 /DNA_START=228 /DNA_END=797 /DNA_ORIENTATION=-